jgi:hypothetical protein
MMSELLKKMNFKAQKKICVLNAPPEFDSQLQQMQIFASIEKEIASENQEFVLIFVKTLKEIEEWAPKIEASLMPDGLFWWAYPKGSSKKYKCDFNRDTGWQSLGNLGYEPVRMVAIDGDWSALRFRKAQFIKTMTRSLDWRMSEEGKKK